MVLVDLLEKRLSLLLDLDRVDRLSRRLVIGHEDALQLSRADASTFVRVHLLEGFRQGLLRVRLAARHDAAAAVAYWSFTDVVRREADTEL